MRARAWLVVLVLVAAVGALYVQTGRFEALDFDDQEYVFANPEVLGGLTPRSIAWALAAFHSANWHPLTWMSHMALSSSSSGPQRTLSGQARPSRRSSRCIR